MIDQINFFRYSDRTVIEIKDGDTFSAIEVIGDNRREIEKFLAMNFAQI